jgi:hypothetical protein
VSKIGRRTRVVEKGRRHIYSLSSELSKGNIVAAALTRNCSIASHRILPLSAVMLHVESECAQVKVTSQSKSIK